MIKILKRIRFVCVAGLYIPYSLVAGSIWLISVVSINVLSLLIMPIEYIITGDTKNIDSCISYIFDDFPKKHDEMVRKFYESIHPDL